MVRQSDLRVWADAALLDELNVVSLTGPSGDIELDNPVMFLSDLYEQEDSQTDERMATLDYSLRKSCRIN